METRYNIIDSQDIHFVRATINASRAAATATNNAKDQSGALLDPANIETLERLAALPEAKLKALLALVG
jgi:hypothetical protein